MPTGYTAAIEDGTVTSARDFALLCTRAFIWQLRDDPWGMPPEKIVPDTKYCDERIYDLQAQLLVIAAMPLIECERRAKQEYLDDITRREDFATKQVEQNKRYQAMKEQVVVWEAPASCENLKQFMLDQIALSATSVDYRLKASPELTGNEWLERNATALALELGRCIEKRRDVISNADKVNTWLAEIRRCFS